jgi:predicted phosphoadenosine phosphosulfate sulfurtransferase
VFPIYDWATMDIWTYLGRTGLPYNKLYDQMHKAGVPISKMRICEPYGDEQRIGLWLYHVVEPDMWPKIVSRVAGANAGALYSRERGNVMGNGKVTKPGEMSWQQFAKFLLDTMPPSTAEHYRNKIAVWLRWYQNHGYPNAEIPDFQKDDTGQQDKASWRRVCKCLLKNDYWCKTIGFSPTKTQASERYTAIMARRREEWGII